MNKPVSLTLLIIGIILTIWGINASESFSSDFSRFFTGSPTEKSIWLLASGVILIVVGGVQLARKR